MQIIKPIFHDLGFGLLGFWVGIASLVLTVFLSVSKLIWADYSRIPDFVVMLCAAFCIIVLLIGTIGKIIILNKVTKKLDSKMTLYSIFKFDEISAIMTNAVITFIILAVISVSLSLSLNNFWISIPAAYLYFGFILLHTGTVFYMNEYRIQGIISYAITVFMVLFMRSNYEIWLTASIGVFFTGFGLDIIIRHKFLDRKKEV